MSLFDRPNSKLLKWLDDFYKPIKIDETASIRRIDRDGYEYQEGDHVMTFQVEMLSGNPDYVLYSGTIDHWLLPFEGEAVTSVDKERILSKVRQFLESRHISYEVEWR